jgi:[ribosomal protein S5]-alanine N-acetyltransferase
MPSSPDAPPASSLLDVGSLSDIETPRLRLEPLATVHAEPMFSVLSDPLLHAYLDSPPPDSIEQLRQSYVRLSAGVSPDGSQRWLNWIVVLPGVGPIGFVQATVVGASAWIGYLLGRAHWSRGYATEATRAMLGHLASVHETSLFRATVEVANSRSITLLQGLGFRLAEADELATQSLSPSERLYVKHAAAGSKER